MTRAGEPEWLPARFFFSGRGGGTIRSPAPMKTAPFAPFWLALALVASAGCLAKQYEKKDPGPALNAASIQALDLVGRERQARKLSAPVLVPDLRAFAHREAVSVARGDESLATA